MTGRSIRDMKEAVFGEKGPDPEILVHLAPSSLSLFSLER